MPIPVPTGVEGPIEDSVGVEDAGKGLADRDTQDVKGDGAEDGQ